MPRSGIITLPPWPATWNLEIATDDGPQVEAWNHWLAARGFPPLHRLGVLAVLRGDRFFYRLPRRYPPTADDPQERRLGAAFSKWLSHAVLAGERSS